MPLTQECPLKQQTYMNLHRPPPIRDIDTVVACRFSLSHAAPRRLGNRRADFESDLRHLLHGHSPEGPF
jgi:hypothetical protein